MQPLRSPCKDRCSTREPTSLLFVGFDGSRSIPKKGKFRLVQLFCIKTIIFLNLAIHNYHYHMKPILAFLTAVLFYSSSFAQTIEAKLWSIAKKEYPTDASMQKFVYDQQKKGYNYMTGVTDAELKRFAEKQYPDDYSMQNFVYDQQKTAKADMKIVTDPEVKRFAVKQYPEDYSMQKFVYDQQAVAKEFMQTRATNSAAKAEARKQYPDDYSMQKFVYEQAVN
jgi:hypothetical protein